MGGDLKRKKKKMQMEGILNRMKKSRNLDRGFSIFLTYCSEIIQKIYAGR